jgi:hypothetical protein
MSTTSRSAILRAATVVATAVRMKTGVEPLIALNLL